MHHFTGRGRLYFPRRFDQLVAYLRDEMGWPIDQDSFEDINDLFYEFTPEETDEEALRGCWLAARGKSCTVRQ